MVELQPIHYFQREGVVAEEDMDAEKADDAEVPEAAVELACAVLADDLTESICQTPSALTWCKHSRNLVLGLAGIRRLQILVDL